MKRLMLALLIAPLLSMPPLPCRGEVLQVATLDFPPFQYEERGQAKGLAVDIVTEVFKRLDRHIEITFYPFPRAIQNIQNGTAHVIFTFYYKKEREKFVTYSTEPLVNQSISLFVRRSAPIRFNGDLSRLAPYSFGLVRFSYGSVLDNAIQNGIIKEIQYVSEMRLNMRKFMHGRFDILPSDRWVAHYYYKKLAAQEPPPFQIRELKPPIQSFPAYMGFSKVRRLEGLRNKVDQTLRNMKRDGSYKAIFNHHSALWEPVP